MVYAGDRLLAVLGFGASAWKVADRDRFIGWSAPQRRRNLQLVVNNARYLILPWVDCHNLASRILSIAAKRLADDWQQHYGFRPVLLETFVNKDRFKGISLPGGQLDPCGPDQARENWTKPTDACCR